MATVPSPVAHPGLGTRSPHLQNAWTLPALHDLGAKVLHLNDRIGTGTS